MDDRNLAAVLAAITERANGGQHGVIELRVRPDNLGLAPGESKDLSFSRTTARPVQSVSIAGFGYHTTGQPQCVATPVAS